MDEFICNRCKCGMDTSPDEEPSEFCDKCAHEVIDELKQKIAQLDAENHKLRMALR